MQPYNRDYTEAAIVANLGMPANTTARHHAILKSRHEQPRRSRTEIGVFYVRIFQELGTRAGQRHMSLFENIGAI